MKKRAPRKSAEKTTARKKAAAQSASLQTDEQRDLFVKLKALRKQLADQAGVPPYVVFSDAHLRDMCVRMPATPEEFLEVNGVGPTKLERYGDVFLEAINS